MLLPLFKKNSIKPKISESPKSKTVYFIAALVVSVLSGYLNDSHAQSYNGNSYGYGYGYGSGPYGNYGYSNGNNYGYNYGYQNRSYCGYGGQRGRYNSAPVVQSYPYTSSRNNYNYASNSYRYDQCSSGQRGNSSFLYRNKSLDIGGGTPLYQGFDYYSQ